MAIWKHKHKEQKYINGGLFWLEYKHMKEAGYKVKSYRSIGRTYLSLTANVISPLKQSVAMVDSPLLGIFESRCFLKCYP